MEAVVNQPRLQFRFSARRHASGPPVGFRRVMGTSGMTGMAAGDHVQFSMQLDGVQIDPKEWWDSHWIKDHIAKRVDLVGFSH
jgi:hypothetical protein